MYVCMYTSLSLFLFYISCHFTSLPRHVVVPHFKAHVLSTAMKMDASQSYPASFTLEI